MLALQAMAELSAMAFGGDSLRLDVGLDAGGVHYKYETITKANAGILQSKQVRLLWFPFQHSLMLLNLHVHNPCFLMYGIMCCSYWCGIPQSMQVR